MTSLWSRVQRAEWDCRQILGVGSRPPVYEEEESGDSAIPRMGVDRGSRLDPQSCGSPGPAAVQRDLIRRRRGRLLRRPYVPNPRVEATHPRYCLRGLPGRSPGRASHKEGESWQNIVWPTSPSMPSKLHNAVALARSQPHAGEVRYLGELEKVPRRRPRRAGAQADGEARGADVLLRSRPDRLRSRVGRSDSLARTASW